jgi:hypothetical protein
VVEMAETRKGTAVGRVGDLVVVAAHRVGETERTGEIREVLGKPDHVHYLVGWDDGRESVLYPSSDATIRAKS